MTFRNNLFEDVTEAWGGTARLFQILNGAVNVTFDHNTGFPEGAILIADQGPSFGVNFTNNLAAHGDYGFFGSGIAEGNATLAAYFPNSVFQSNGIIGGNAALYPAGNFFPAAIGNAGFMDAPNGNYALLPNSPRHNAGADGTDVGIDANQLNAAQGGVAPAPAIAPGGAVSAATFSTTIGAGSLISLFGTNLAGTMVSATTTPLPTSIAGTQVLVYGKAVPLLFVSPTQINLQMPTDTWGNLAVQVVTGSASSATITLTVVPDAPGILTISGAQGAILNQDSSLNSANNPAPAGSVIQIFATELGSTSPQAGAAQANNIKSTYNVTISPVTVLINGTSVPVQFAGAAPGLAGLFQVNATVPALPPGSSSGTLQLQINGTLSNIVAFNPKP